MAARDAARLNPRPWGLVALSVLLLAGVPLALLPLGVTPSPLGWALLGALAAVPLAFALARVLRARRDSRWARV